MKIGISTSWDFLSGKNEKEESRLTLESFSSVESYLKFIKDLGVSSIELRKFDPGLNETEVKNICKNLKVNNFSLTIHGEIAENNLDLDLGATFPWLKTVIRVYNDRRLIIVVHPIEGQNKTQDEYRHLTVRKIKNITDTIERDNLNVQIALEINQFKEKKTSPGCTYDGILKIVSAVDSDKLGICLDFGHTWSNIRRGFLNKTIPDQFLNRVIHTHIHDLSSEYKTHWPLTFGNVPVEAYIKLLVARQFNGVLNLELNYDRFKTAISAIEAINASLKILGDIVKNI
jgi:sugar phosphate isomerase/epimerase